MQIEELRQDKVVQRCILQNVFPPPSGPGEGGGIRRKKEGKIQKFNEAKKCIILNVSTGGDSIRIPIIFL